MSDRQLIDPGLSARVRLATREDGYEIMQICKAMHEEAGLLSLSEKKVKEMLDEAFSSKNGLIGVIGDSGGIEACIVLRIGQVWYSEEWVLEEYMSYVLPDYRRSSNAVCLIEFAKTCARKIINPDTERPLTLFVGVTSTDRTEAKMKLYGRRFGKPCGGFFMFDGAAA